MSQLLVDDGHWHLSGLNVTQFFSSLCQFTMYAMHSRSCISCYPRHRQRFLSQVISIFCLTYNVNEAQAICITWNVRGTRRLCRKLSNGIFLIFDVINRCLIVGQFEEFLNTTLQNRIPNFCTFSLAFYKITDGETGQASCSQLEVLTNLSCVLRTTDPIHFYKSDFHENFL